MPSPRNGGVPAQPTRGATPPPRDSSVAVQKSLPLRLSGSHAPRQPCLPLSACSSGANFNGSRPGRARSPRRTLPWGLIPLTPLHHRLCIIVHSCVSSTRSAVSGGFATLAHACGASPGGLRRVASFTCWNGLLPGTFHHKLRTSSPARLTSLGTGRGTPSPS
ncbi:MAG: hypothetical protein PWR07_1613 [Bacillota bacterium]|nr:hypothetical protein [Bacillota bacterium]